MDFNNRYIKRRRPYRKLRVFLRSIRIYGGRATVYDLLNVMVEELKLDSITKRASYMAFNFTLAIFPTVIFLFTMIAYIRIPDLNISILNFLRDFLPREMYAVTRTTIEDIINIQRGGLLSFGFFFALILSTNGIMALMDAFDKKYHTFHKRSYLKKRLIATILTFVLSLVVLLAISIIFFGTYILDVLVYYEVVTNPNVYSLIIVFKYIAVIVLFFLATAMIFYYVPAVHDKWPFFSAGAVVATILIFLISVIFSYYISKFNTYNKFYGSMGALIGLMIWLDFISMALVVGFEINISIDSVTKRLEK